MEGSVIEVPVYGTVFRAGGAGGLYCRTRAKATRLFRPPTDLRGARASPSQVRWHR